MDSPLEMLRRDGEGFQGPSVLMGDLVRRMGVVLGVVAEEPLGGGLGPELWRYQEISGYRS